MRICSMIAIVMLGLSAWAQPPEAPLLEGARPDGPRKEGFRRGPDGGPTGGKRPGGAGSEGKWRGSKGPGGRSGEGGSVREEMVDRFLVHLREKDPAMADRLTGLRKTDPDAFSELLRDVMHKRRIAAPGGEGPRPMFKPSDPRLKELGSAMRDQLIAYREDPSDSNKVALRELVAEQFDLTMEERGKHIEKMEALLARLREERQEQIDSRDAAIDENMERILNAKARPAE